jgi:hypothetical protein
MVIELPWGAQLSWTSTAVLGRAELCWGGHRAPQASTGTGRAPGASRRAGRWAESVS